MAFQTDPNFAAYLRSAAASPSVSDAAPAANFLLEERLAPAREAAFLSGAPVAWDAPGLLSSFGNHFDGSVGVSRVRPLDCHTFAALNDPARLDLESHRDVVRFESVAGLYNLNKSGFGSARELADALRALAANGPAALSDDARDALQVWLDGANAIRDARPMFAAPWGEVEPLLGDPAWAARLRDAMGLVHLGGTPGAPLPVVLMRYNLSRSEAAAKKARLSAWAATPTVLDAGDNKGPNPAFFPFPPAAVSAGSLGFGQTVDLSGAGIHGFVPELVHFRIDYALADFHRVGELTDRIDDPQLAAARARHLGLLAGDLRHRADVP